MIRNEAEKAESVEWRSGSICGEDYEMLRDGLRLQFKIALEHRFVP